MRFVGRHIINIIAALVVLPLLLFAGYDVLVFQPRRTEISTLTAPSGSESSSPSLTISTLVQRSYQGHLSSGVARLLINQLQIPRIMKGGAGWQVTYALWSTLISVHLSEQEKIAIIASRAFMGNGHYGFASEAMARFGKPLSELTTTETATVVALMHAPDLYQKTPDRLTKRRDWLLSELKQINEGPQFSVQSR